MIFNMSGGGANLNFKIVGGTSEPPSPSNNTIWIDTNIEITSWALSATIPTSPSEGMVWITIGDSSTVSFNALKKNSIMVYPISAQQYISGSWTDKTAASYQNGSWVDWIVFLKPSELKYSTYAAANGRISVSGDAVNFGTSGDTSTINSESLFVFDDPINVIGKRTLTATLTLTQDNTNQYGCIAITSTKPAQVYNKNNLPNTISSVLFPTSKGTTEVVLNLGDASGSVYVVVCSAMAFGSLTNFRVS